MPVIAIKGDKIDGSGSRINFPAEPDIFANDQPVVLDGYDVDSHGIHFGSINIEITRGNKKVFGNDKVVASLDDRADCGHGIGLGGNNQQDVEIDG